MSHLNKIYPVCKFSYGSFISKGEAAVALWIRPRVAESILSRLETEVLSLYDVYVLGGYKLDITHSY